MKFLSIQPFVASGREFEKAKSFFKDLGFLVKWDGGDYVGFEKDGCQFILQKYDHKEFAENFMLSVTIENATTFRQSVVENKLVEKYGIQMSQVMDQPYGKEVNIIDLAGVCWHFVES
jgi:hypothetical protein